MISFLAPLSSSLQFGFWFTTFWGFTLPFFPNSSWKKNSNLCKVLWVVINMVSLYHSVLHYCGYHWCLCGALSHTLSMFPRNPSILLMFLTRHIISVRLRSSIYMPKYTWLVLIFKKVLLLTVQSTLCSRIPWMK